MVKQKIIMWLSIGALILSFLLFLIPVQAQENNGKLYHLSYSPDEPVVLEDLTISVGVENPGNDTQNYLMGLKIAHEGKIVHKEEFIFSLEKTKGIFFTPKFTPQDIGEFEIIVQLYDKDKIDLFDTKIIKFNSVSQLGPFDIIIDPLTYRVRPGFLLPTKLLLENMGNKGTDINVEVRINCPDKNLTQSLTIFLPANNRTERLVSMQTCDQEGLYEILASILVFNKTWVSSVSQFFVNSSFIQLQFEAPEKIILKPGENYSFPIEVTNTGNQKITDLQFIVQRIPLAWQKTSPTSTIEVQPGEKVIFVVTITIPQDAEPKSYEVRMTAAAEEVLERKITTLEIDPLAILPTAPAKVISVQTIIIYAASIIISGVIILLIILRKRRSTQFTSTTKVIPAMPQQSDRAILLKKIKENIKPR